MNLEFWSKTFHGVADELARSGRHDRMSDGLRGRFFLAASEVRRLTETFHELAAKLESEEKNKSTP